LVASHIQCPGIQKCKSSQNLGIICLYLTKKKAVSSPTSANFGTLMATEVFSVDMLVEASVPLDSLEEASNESLRVSGLEEP